MKKKPCSKRRYATLAEAKNAIAAMRKYPSVVYKKPYRCAKCDGWHITSTPARRGHRIQR